MTPSVGAAASVDRATLIMVHGFIMLCLATIASRVLMWLGPPSHFDCCTRMDEAGYSLCGALQEFRSLMSFAAGMLLCHLHRCWVAERSSPPSEAASLCEVISRASSSLLGEASSPDGVAGRLAALCEHTAARAAAVDEGPIRGGGALPLLHARRAVLRV
eukprot:CAMPEP_0168438758 /NCGR_PEP_ID=MMETSP0228-20121227/42125_1 /TAXON_ID=133427 /ORGANISM="Protoceratium reticulatum, Strain CCCM 535 (=CCMP 1889)" /LENGTH=159 /DNA_ID=CAMNT_0008453033 /DNA_START=49 /DNA_END=529 /DNA_ORIENTATION=-